MFWEGYINKLIVWPIYDVYSSLFPVCLDSKRLWFLQVNEVWGWCFFFSISWWEKRKDREGTCGRESLCEWRRMSANNHDMYFAMFQIKSLLVIWEKSIFWAVVFWFVLGIIVWSTLPVRDAESESCRFLREEETEKAVRAKGTVTYCVNADSVIIPFLHHLLILLTIHCSGNLPFYRSRSVCFFFFCGSF